MADSCSEEDAAEQKKRAFTAAFAAVGKQSGGGELDVALRLMDR